MQDSFYRNLINVKEKVILFIGGGGKSTLMERMSHDCRSMGKTVLISSLYPYITPIEAKLLLSNNPSQIQIQLTKEFKKNTIIYLGKKSNEKGVIGFTIGELRTIISKITADHIFIEADLALGQSLSSYENVPVSLSTTADRYINVIGSDMFNQPIGKKSLLSEDPYWKIHSVFSPHGLADWFTSHPVLTKLSKKTIPGTLFINKVENIYLENLAIPFARNLKLSGIDKVVVGSVFNSRLNVIQ
jgi:hypothetical protein